MSDTSATARRALGRYRLLTRLIALEWPMRLVDPLMGGFNPFVTSYRQDPYPAYRALRERAAVYFHPVLRIWFSTRHADVVKVLRDPRFSVNRTQAPLFRALDIERTLGPDLATVVTQNLLMLDPPEHTRLRRLVNQAFTPRVALALRPRISAIVTQLLDQAAERGGMELIRDFAYPLPVIVIAEMLGVPTEDRAVFKRWSDVLSALLDPFVLPSQLENVKATFGELAAYFRRVFAQRRREPRDDLLSSLCAAEEAGGRLSEAELLSITALLLGAGHETTTSLITNSVVALLRHPDQRARLISEPELAESAVEELLRFDSPVQMTDRLALEDVELSGRGIRKGQIVAVLIGAANRDPEAFHDPDRLDLGRADNHHIAFGHGHHFCLGAALARAEAELAVPALFARFPTLSGDPSRARYRQSITLRAPIELPLCL
jgi:cytochrome P450